jgi:NAD(P)-dependent dehydrogenase (short-subunit alcohol dehydrogenase family)
MSRKLALVTGVGPGTGLSVVKRLVAGGYDVAMVARNEERLRGFEKQIPGTRTFVCDVANDGEFSATLERIKAEFGPPEIAVHNAVGGVWGNFMEIDPAVLEHNFQTNVMALLHLARGVAPAMIEAGRGAIIASGNTSALRGKSNFAGFAPTKAAQRILAESVARELGPKGIHVAYVLIDAVIDVAWARARYPNHPDDFFIRPADIADEIWHVAHQPKSAWSFNVEVRPYKEQW